MLNLFATLTVSAGLLALATMARAQVPDWVVYPDEEWLALTPEEAGVTDLEAWNRWLEEATAKAHGAAFQGEDHSGNQWGVAITRSGYLIQTFGDPDYKYQTASLGKTFTKACLQTEPGKIYHYSSGGYWRFAQALTAVWNRNLKEVLDEKLFGPLGIAPEDWEWTLGQTMHDDIDAYPRMPGYGLFIDPPYEIQGHPVVGGQWVVMSAQDLARFGRSKP